MRIPLDAHWKQTWPRATAFVMPVACANVFGCFYLDLTGPPHKQDLSCQNTADTEPDLRRPKQAADGYWFYGKQGWTYGRCNDPECELRFKACRFFMSRLRIYSDFVLILFVSVCIPFAEVGDETTIAGLDEGIRGMREGGYRRFLIPPQIAYQEGAASAVVTIAAIVAIVAIVAIAKCCIVRLIISDPQGRSCSRYLNGMT